MSEMQMRGGGGGGGGGGGFDPSNLHLKRELTQIRKASRVLRDPGTTSSWRSPLSSARSAAANGGSASNHNYFHHFNGGGGSQIPVSQPQLRGETSGREKKIFLYNWKTQRSSSERTASTARSEEKRRNQRRMGVDDDGNDASSSSLQEGSADDSLSDARNGDSKSDTYVANRYASMAFKTKGTNHSPSIRKTSIRKKSKINTHLANVLRQQIMQTRNSKQALQGLPSMAALGDQTDEDDSNSEDLRRFSGSSPLLARLKKKNKNHTTSKILRKTRKEDSSYTYSTPALSTSSFNRYFNWNPSTVESWDATTASYNGGEDDGDDQLDLPGRQGCGIPCYWSKRSTPKRGAFGSSYSPSLSDTLRRKGSSILCGGQNMYQKRRRGSSSGSKSNRRLASRTAKGVIPLLTNNGDGQGDSSLGSGQSDDELSTNFEELDLEALSRLDGRRWSPSCRSREGLEIVALNGEMDGEEGSTPDNIRSLSQKYRPMFFEELIGQNIVVQSLMNAISRGRIAPVYLFQGPRGTGKTSAARIFAAALNCLATDETKPCGVCRECADFISGKSKDLKEVDSTTKRGVERVKHLLRNLSAGPSSAFPQYRIFIIDECHLLPSKTWLAFLKFLEDPPPRIVFIFVTTDLDNVPRTVLSRCQKYIFNKIKDSDIITRLRKISTEENLDVESEALDLIALNADGSLRDAETMLDQLSLLGKRITTNLVNELVGVVPDDKLLELLELAMSSDTAETVKRARELMDSGVDPLVVMSQLATLIMDIIAGTNHIIDSKCNDSLYGGRSLTEAELDGLKHALKLLSEAEKQLRVSSERSMWFTATLLQLGSVTSSDVTQSGSSRRQSTKATSAYPTSASLEVSAQMQGSDARFKSTSPTSLSKGVPRNNSSMEDPFLLTNGVDANSHHTRSRLVNGHHSSISHDDAMVDSMISRQVNSDKLDEIWVQCIERCHSKTLRQLLLTHGKLICISDVEGLLVAYIAFGDKDVKTRAERFVSSITNSFEIILRYNVEVRLVLLPDGESSLETEKTADVLDTERKANHSSSAAGYSNLDLHNDQEKRGSCDDCGGRIGGNFQSVSGSPLPFVEGSAETAKEKVPMQRIESIIHEQRLETAWLQAVEKGTPGSLSRSKPEKNQILPQEGIYSQNELESMNSLDLSSQRWENELNHDMKLLKISDGRIVHNDQIGKRIDHCPISPSLLHDSSLIGNFSKESMGYESGSGARGCGSIFCWNNGKPQKKGKGNQGARARQQKGSRFLLFSECAKTKNTENRSRR